MEHRVIERVLRGIEEQCYQLENAVGEDKEDIVNFFTRAISFLKEFSDDFHHHKEEQCLFPHLNEGFRGPVEMMHLEHNEGRELVKRMTSFVRDIEMEDDPEELEQLFKDLSESSFLYTDLLRRHIQKEDQILFPRVETFLSDDLKKEIALRWSDLLNDEKIMSRVRGHVEWASNYEVLRADD